MNRVVPRKAGGVIILIACAFVLFFSRAKSGQDDVILVGGSFFPGAGQAEEITYVIGPVFTGKSSSQDYVLSHDLDSSDTKTDSNHKTYLPVTIR